MSRMRVCMPCPLATTIDRLAPDGVLAIWAAQRNRTWCSGCRGVRATRGEPAVSDLATGSSARGLAFDYAIHLAPVTSAAGDPQAAEGLCGTRRPLRPSVRPGPFPWAAPLWDYLCNVNADALAPGPSRPCAERTACGSSMPTMLGSLTQIEIAEQTGLSQGHRSQPGQGIARRRCGRADPSVRNGRRAVSVRLPYLTACWAPSSSGIATSAPPRRRLARTRSSPPARMPLPADHRADEDLERGATLLQDLDRPGRPTFR